MYQYTGSGLDGQYMFALQNSASTWKEISFHKGKIRKFYLEGNREEILQYGMKLEGNFRILSGRQQGSVV